MTQIHLSAHYIVYAVDVPIVQSNSSSVGDFAETEVPHVAKTAREYGQQGKGATKEWTVKRNIGDDAISVLQVSRVSQDPSIYCIGNLAN